VVSSARLLCEGPLWAFVASPRKSQRGGRGDHHLLQVRAQFCHIMLEGMGVHYYCRARRLCSTDENTVWIGSIAHLLLHLEISHSDKPELGNTKESLAEVVGDARSLEEKRARVQHKGIAYVDTSLLQMHADTAGSVRVCRCELHFLCPLSVPPPSDRVACTIADCTDTPHVVGMCSSNGILRHYALLASHHNSFEDVAGHLPVKKTVESLDKRKGSYISVSEWLALPREGVMYEDAHISLNSRAMRMITGSDDTRSICTYATNVTACPPDPTPPQPSKRDKAAVAGTHALCSAHARVHWALCNAHAPVPPQCYSVCDELRKDYVLRNIHMHPVPAPTTQLSCGCASL
jgi:hypothetical protein